MHPYLIKKQIKPHGTGVVDAAQLIKCGVRVGLSGLLLVIPLYDWSKNLRALQLIDAIGRKRFLGAVGGLHCKIGQWPFKSTCFTPTVIALCEGFSTAASVNEATGIPTIIAFSAGALPDLATQCRALHPQTHILVCADLDDAGRKATEKIRKTVKGVITATPVFSNQPKEKPATDWNDLHCAEGLAAVRKQIMETVQDSIDIKD